MGIALVVRDDCLHAVECLDNFRFLGLHRVHFSKKGAYLRRIGRGESINPLVTQFVFPCAVGIRLFKRRDVSRKDFAHIVQQRHEEDAREIDGGKFIAQKVRHQCHPPAVLGDTLLPSRCHPRVACALLEPGDAVNDGEIVLGRHSCSFRMVEKSFLL